MSTTPPPGHHAPDTSEPPRTTSAAEGSAALHFEDDPGARRSTWIALGIAVALIVWMGSGLLLSEDEAPAPLAREAVPPVAVAITASRAEPVTRVFSAEGQALPDRDTALRAEAAGTIAEVLVRRGQDVEADAVVARIDSARLESELARAEAEFREAERDLVNAERLARQGVVSANEREQSRLARAGAEAQLAAAREALGDSTIRAPFAGRIESFDLDPGEYVQAGAEVGRLVDNRPLLVSVAVPQQALTRLRNGQTATVSFITGEEREGTVTFVGTAASAATRTFPAEVSVDNPEGLIPAGISAEVAIPTDEVVAHFVSPSTVSLAPDGELGVKTVVNADEEGVGTVEFHPIRVVRAQVDGVWVSGLPERADIITIGQGYVREGDRVLARAADGTDGADAVAGEAESDGSVTIDTGEEGS